MASGITLSAGVRQNLLSLQQTGDLMATTQNRLASGKKVNSALDNPTNFFTSASLQSRSNDLGSLLDSMSNGIKTLEAADNGLSSITKTVESMQSTLRQARQDKSNVTASYSMSLGASPAGTEKLSITGGSVGTTAVDVDLTTSQSVVTGGAFTAVDFENAGANDGAVSMSVSVNGATAVAISITYAEANAVAGDASAVTADEMAELLNNEFTTGSIAATASVNGAGRLVITGAAANGNVADVTISGFTAANGTAGSGLANGSGTDGNVTAKTVDTLVSEINANNSLLDKVRASNDNGKLRIENQSTSALTVAGANSTTGTITGTGTASIAGNDVRKNLVAQFNGFRDQLDKIGRAHV